MEYAQQEIQQQYHKINALNQRSIHTLGMKPPINVLHARESLKPIIQQMETHQITLIQQQQQIADIS